ncbi:MAG: Rrf2 family transcriptional regulator [Thermoguttaceae bacterium]|nr:Rrf2 family transcriptional regulator [Thermoguttaceae bacterium]
MRISTKGRYGLRILLDLAAHQADARPRLIREIAKSQQISEKYVSRLILALRDAGIVGSFRGARGGYSIVKPLDQVTLLEAIETMEGPLEVVECLAADAATCERSETCGPRLFWRRFNDEIRAILQKYSVQDLFDSCCASEQGGLSSLVSLAAPASEKAAE